MLCLTETDEEGSITGVGPAAVPWPRCTPGCCPLNVKLQIRVRYSSGSARLCAGFLDDGDGTPDDDTKYYSHSNTVITYHRFKNGDPPTEIGTCTYTEDADTGSSPIVTGSSSLPDCDGTPAAGTWSPDACNDTMYDPPADFVNSDAPVITVSGDSASKNDVRAAAVGAMVSGSWSDWADVCEIDPREGSPEAGYLNVSLAGASIGDNGFGGGEFVANASQFECELRVLGAFPISIAVSEGPDFTTAPVNRYVLSPGTAKGFSVATPSFGVASDQAMLCCACPVQFAAS